MAKSCAETPPGIIVFKTAVVITLLYKIIQPLRFILLCINQKAKTEAAMYTLQCNALCAVLLHPAGMTVDNRITLTYGFIKSIASLACGK